MNKNRKIDIRGILLLILGIFLTVGVKIIFNCCDPKDDGSWMRCHWAEQSVFGVGIALSVMAVIRLIARRADTKKGVSAAMIPAALLNIFIPGILIGLCMMSEMRCRAVMRPSVSVISAVIAIIAVIDVIMLNKESKQ